MRRGVAAAAICVSLGLLAASEISRWQNTVSTDDATLQADIVSVVPKISGFVTQVLCMEGQSVHAGDVLFEFDRSDLAEALSQETARIKSIKSELNILRDELRKQQFLLSAASADLRSSNVKLELEGENLRRAESLRKGGDIPLRTLQEAYAAQRTAEATASGMKSRVQVAGRDIEITRDKIAQTSAREEEEISIYKRAARELKQATIRAPIDGQIASLTVRGSQYTASGTRLAVIVPVEKAYVVANFKESDLAKIAPGARARITIDAFPGESFTGAVERIIPGTEAEFAPMPSENVGSNFIKIIQRVPVKIIIDPNTAWKDQLRPGLSAEVAILYGPP